ncbi:MAG: hypothetical protein CML19_08115 [Pusillimonas sp.]|nr:hypothetical protein [Parvibaculum sp.]MBC42177.1 hypothetical protein [Pusillimonas sp.]|tara:strand:- start:3 stop:548 length:546 start_codon:yes stop_codon:yes gene_type:complete
MENVVKKYAVKLEEEIVNQEDPDYLHGATNYKGYDWLDTKVISTGSEFDTKEDAIAFAKDCMSKVKEEDRRNYEIEEINYGYANYHGYTDVNPFEIVRIVSDKTIEIKAMDAKPLPWKRDFHAGGFFGHTSNQRDQKWEITSIEEATPFRIRKSKYGQWKSADGSRFGLAEKPRKFYDYNF